MLPRVARDRRYGLVLRVTLPVGARPEVQVIPVDAGLGDRPARLAADPSATFALLEALGGAVLRSGGWVP